MKFGSWKLRAITLVLGASAARATASCAEASGAATGGDLTEAGVVATTPPEFDASDPDLQALIARACKTPEWRGLYRDLFGPTGQPGSCAYVSTCHGAPGAAGAMSGSGIECFDEQSCCASIFDKGLVTQRSADRPERAPLIGILRRRTDAGTRGFMPKEPSDYFFEPETLARIADWVRLAAPDAGADTGLDAADAALDADDAAADASDD